VDSVVAEQITVDPVPDLWWEVQKAEATLALSPVDVSAWPAYKCAGLRVGVLTMKEVA
jgi:hypothetical protein